MSFLKKLLGTQRMSDEQELQGEEVKNKKKQKQQEKVDEIRAQQEKYFGKAGFLNSISIMTLSRTISYFEEFIQTDGEEVLAAISAEYDKTKKREIKGMLIATNLQLHFVSNGIGAGQFHETFEYIKMNGIALAPDGFLSKELLIDIGRSRKKFDDISNDDVFHRFLSVVQNQINSTKKKAKNNPSRTVSSSPASGDKYKQLEQIGKLHEQGILTEDEFEAEKKKILNT